MGMSSEGLPEGRAMTCSVVITTCERPELVLRSVKSALDQTRRPDELIVVDDCSSVDVSPSIVDCVGGHVPLTIERLSTRSGAPAARNAGAKLARGDVLMFLDDDDIWEPRKIEAQMRQLTENPGLGWVYTGMLLVDATRGDRILNASRDHLSGSAWPDILFRNFVGSTSAVAMRRGLFHQVGGFDPSLPALQDYDLWLRLALASPVVHDGEHNLRFASVSLADARLSSAIDNYQMAHRQLAEKYRAELARLSATERRRFHAQSEILLMGKYLSQGAYLRAAARLVRSAALYPPTLGRLSRSLLARLKPHPLAKRMP